MGEEPGLEVGAVKSGPVEEGLSCVAAQWRGEFLLKELGTPHTPLEHI